jgi:lipopolysaccharide export system permease protein
MIFIIVNFMEQMDSFMDSKVKIETIINYYIVYLPEILKIITPISILISCLFAIGRLSNNNEITIIKSGGMGLYRLLIPIAFVGLLLSAGQFVFNGWIVPKSNLEKERISKLYLNRAKSGGPINQLAFRDKTDKNVLINYYDPTAQRGYKVTIETYKDLTDPIPKLEKKIEAQIIVWNDTQKCWILKEVIVRDIISNVKVETNRFREMQIELNFNEKQIERISLRADEMTFTEMKEYIELLHRSGKDVKKMKVNYHSAQALPLANFIMILFAVSFASVKKKGGLAVQIAAAMVIAFVYLIFFEVFKPIGIALNFPPQLVGWFANLVFIVAGIVSIFKTRT